MADTLPARILLTWYLEAGVDETIGEIPLDRYQAEVAPAAATQAEEPAPRRSRAPAVSVAPRPLPPRSPPPPVSPAAPEAARAGSVQSAYALAAAASSVDELVGALRGFDGCPLRTTATQLVFYDGNPTGRIVFVGEAPGAEEDRLGLPFVGPSGRLLDRMMATIGLDRGKVLITNTVFWRPPGNRHPTTLEIATCLPFLERLIELVDPAFLIALGGAAAKSLLGRGESIGRLRGHWFPYASPGLARPLQATATFHPAYLLRSPGQKREAWRDLLDIRRKLEAGPG